jgi:RecA-family ATPase
VDEASAEPLLGGDDDTVLAAGSTFVFYGGGGAGKTTLAVDLTFHLAAGRAWLGLPIPRPLNVLVIENEGPRGKFRTKLRAKLEAWTDTELAGTVDVLEEPWALFTFDAEPHREALAAHVAEHGYDVVIAGPVQRLGMRGGGTPDEVGAFTLNLELVRGRLDRPLAVVLVHHENKAGAVAGAWEGVPDTLAHVQARGNGATRLFWQKTRWSSELHGKAWTLL